MKVLTQKQADNIARDLVTACADIKKLSENAYAFISTSNGFACHNNRIGFQLAHREPGRLRAKILEHKERNQYTAFEKGSKHYKYYKQKRDIYNVVCQILENQRAFTYTLVETSRRIIKVYVYASSEKAARTFVAENPRAYTLLRDDSLSVDYMFHPENTNG